jgi:hypothetical protein
MTGDRMISSVAVRIESAELTGEELSELLGPSTWHADRDSLVSARRPDGPRRQMTTWIKESSVSSDEISVHVDSLQDVMRAANHARTQGVDITIDLTFMVEAREMGFIVALEVGLLKRLAELGCGLVADVYNSSSD